VCDDPSMPRPTLLIVDDHEEFRTSARTLLELEGFDVVGVAEDGAAALSAAERLRPDIVLLDVQLPGCDGFAIARALRASEDGPRVVLISSRDRSAYAAELHEAPVAGFLAKSELTAAALHALVA
jgi:DNA-binding NarL/FixJ family response regulator